ncbi:MAG: hypothetical protein NTW96_07340 [Planctomycetia bacterium]|nr:hypothetical protein [Planctomycetia bacterium]
MADREEPQPLIPQYSIRWLLAVTACCAVLFSIMGLAVRGSQWAMAVSIGAGALVLMMTVYAMLFGLVWAFSLIGHREPAAGSPFAASPPADDRDHPSEPVILE